MVFSIEREDDISSHLVTEKVVMKTSVNDCKRVKKQRERHTSRFLSAKKKERNSSLSTATSKGELAKKEQKLRNKNKIEEKDEEKDSKEGRRSEDKKERLNDDDQKPVSGLEGHKQSVQSLSPSLLLFCEGKVSFMSLILSHTLVLNEY